jgi:hypothetical protein
VSADSRKTTAAESVISRWSRRKLEAEQAQAESHEKPVQETATSLDAQAADAIVEEQKPLTDADMPDIDSLGEDSDFTGFMSPGVSDKLRNLALRKLFHAPVFNIRDGLDEYDDDYTSFEKLGDIVTSDMKHQIEVQQRKLREALEQDSQARSESGPEAAQDREDEDETEIETETETDSETRVAMKPQQAAPTAPDDPEIETETGHE